jgi:hypothetical protein
VLDLDSLGLWKAYAMCGLCVGTGEVEIRFETEDRMPYFVHAL